MRFALASALAAAASLALTGCWNTCDDVLCGPCPPMLTIRVTSTDGSALTGVSTTRPEVTCAEDGVGGWSCSLQGEPDVSPGDTVELDVSATGYQPQHVAVTIPPDDGGGCCSCGYQPQNVSVKLAPP